MCKYRENQHLFIPNLYNVSINEILHMELDAKNVDTVKPTT